jgi:hypothetical protein
MADYLGKKVEHFIKCILQSVMQAHLAKFQHNKYDQNNFQLNDKQFIPLQCQFKFKIGLQLVLSVYINYLHSSVKYLYA